MGRRATHAASIAKVHFNDEKVGQTHVEKRTLHPRWDYRWKYRISNDTDVQFALVELRVYDQDVVSADDIIGTVRFDLSLLYTEKINGWLPIVDSLRGICGELLIEATIEYIEDVNPHRDDSIGVKFYKCPADPGWGRVRPIPGFGYVFVEEQIVHEDPEYKFLDNFRKQRASNSNRQRLLATIVTQVKKKIGRKVRLCAMV
jgi:hypothetical protein